MVNVAHNGDDRRTGLQFFFRVIDIGFGQRVLSCLGKVHFQFHTKFAAHQAGGIKVQFAVDVCHHAQQKQFL